MTIVFIAGSLSIKRLDPLFLERIKAIVESDFSIVVGDAEGADTSIQKALFEFGAKKVTVYCSGVNPRNNIGGWPVESVHTTQVPGSRAFFVAKDIKMAEVANYGLMIWDAKSTGTLSNVIELLNNERSSRVFVNKKRTFITVSDASGLKQLADSMSEGARAKADDKINLSTKIAAIKHKQFQLSL